MISSAVVLPMLTEEMDARSCRREEEGGRWSGTPSAGSTPSRALTLLSSSSDKSRGKKNFTHSGSCLNHFRIRLITVVRLTGKKEHQLNRYGKIFSCSLVGKRAVVSVDPAFNRFVMQNEGRLFQSSYPKSFRDLVGKNGVITMHGEKQRKLHGIASSMMQLEQLKFHFLKDIQLVMLDSLCNFYQGQVIVLQDVCRKASCQMVKIFSIYFLRLIWKWSNSS